MKVVKAPGNFLNAEKHRTWYRTYIGKTIFLAGSIEMGKAENWQKRTERELRNYDVLILNPRRDDWDSSWVQNKDNPHFREQVEWELMAQEFATWIVFYFDPDTKSPITLLELGLAIQKTGGNGELLVCCPDGYWRKGNVDMVCERYRVNQVDTFESMIRKIKSLLPDPME